jgi:hypothetical protein
MKEEITDEQRSVLQIKFEDDSKIYLASASHMTVGNPYYATRYAPLDDRYPERQKGRDTDLNWMQGCYEAEFNFVPFLQAVEEYKQLQSILN